MKNRPKISIYIAMSVDGFIAREDHSLDWLDRVGGYDDDYGYRDFVNSIDALVIGRKTYDIATTVPDPYPGKRVIVLSNTLNALKEGMELYHGDLVELVSKLHDEGIKHIWVDGGTTLSQFLQLQLVDAMILGIVPVILGRGISLFNRIEKEISLQLVSSQSYPSGFVQINYKIYK
jgi:dihydrofolate reductase